MAVPAVVLAVVPMGAAGTAPALAAGFTQTTAHFHAVNLGPGHDHSCDIIYDLYVPNDAGASHQVPAILTTNGFGGSKADQSGEAALWASHDYEVLSYSGLGFGDSSCPIELDSPEWDGRAASQLVTLLGSRPEVIKDNAATHDPRIGTWGGSYGGGFQFALAAVDNRIDAMIPEITWNDLAYSLIPNNNSPNFLYDQLANPGVEKVEWTSLFFAEGQSEPVQHPGLSGWTDNAGGAAGSGSFNPRCPGFDQAACDAQVQGAADGYPNAATIATLHSVSAQQRFFQGCPAGNYPPTLLAQGQNDTLFTMADAVANYRGTKSCGGTAKLVLKEGGHSGANAAGEYNNTDLSKGYLTQMELNWFDHYLKGSHVSTGPEVEYFRDWVTYDQSGWAKPAYAGAESWPVGKTETLYLSGSGDLVPSLDQVKAGTVNFAAPIVAPFSYSETSALQGSFNSIAPTDPPGTAATFTTGVLSHDIDSVGIPTADFMLSDANATASVLPSLNVVLFGKIYDLDASGTATLVHRIVSPVRIADITKPVHINLPGVAHRYAAGHRLQLVLATTDAAYVGSRAPHVLTIAPDPQHPGTLTLPVVSASEGRATAESAQDTKAASSSVLPDTAAPARGSSGILLLLVAAVFATAALVVRPPGNRSGRGPGIRRRRRWPDGRSPR
jgi:hypothetical protein